VKQLDRNILNVEENEFLFSIKSPTFRILLLIGKLNRNYSRSHRGYNKSSYLLRRTFKRSCVCALLPPPMIGHPLTFYLPSVTIICVISSIGRIEETQAPPPTLRPARANGSAVQEGPTPEARKGRAQGVEAAKPPTLSGPSPS
jgi:hypothetical protein